MAERTSIAKKSARSRFAFAAINFVSAQIVYLGVFIALPTRWAPVDIGAGVTIALLVSGGAGLALGRPWGERLARIASAIVLAIGLITVVLMCLSIGFLSGAYGPIGKAGAIIFALVIALIVPYGVALPAVQLVWLGPRRPITKSEK